MWWATIPLIAAAMLGCGETGSPPAPPDPAPQARRPNVLFIVWDTVRADHLSLYGYDRATTPSVAR